MRKLPLPLLVILFFTSCQKQISKETTQEEIAGVATNKQAKVMLCHYDPVTKTSKTIEVPQNAVAGHLAHGDLEGDCSNVLVTICEQDWTKRNLDVDHYQNGDPIPQVTDPTEWAALATGAWCYYNNDPAEGTIYGKLYNWYALTDPRGITPTGWHVPSYLEWITLFNCVDLIDPPGNIGGKLKTTGNISDGTGLWFTPNTGATNSSGFSGLPGGIRWDNGDFSYKAQSGNWWNTNAGAIGLYSYTNGYVSYSPYTLRFAYSIRCVRD